MRFPSMPLDTFEARINRSANRAVVASDKREALELDRCSSRKSGPVFTKTLCSNSLVDNLHINMSFESFVLLDEMAVDMGRENHSLTSQANKSLETTVD